MSRPPNRRLSTLPRPASLPKQPPSLRDKYKLDARRDTPDLRDLLYVPTLVEVPTEIPLARYQNVGVPILDQGAQGACTGYGLATVIHYLLRVRRVVPDTEPVSQHMLYRMARRYDEWPGEKDAGSSARGAMKGWHKHGVCSFDEWKASGNGTSDTLLTSKRAKDALARPLGAYFRVNQADLVAMHAALAEVGILYASCSTHAGWDKVGPDGIIRYEDGDEGGHAFAIVAFDRTGFWIQNSWRDTWGRGGFCHISYDDWLKNGTDVWVARLGAPVDATAVFEAAAAGRTGTGVRTPLDLALLRPHVVGIGNEGELRPGGILGTDKAAVEHLFDKGGDFDTQTANWPVKRLLLYAHGGLNNEEGALQRVQNYRQALLQAQVYPVAFVWKTDYWTTISNALEDAKKKRRPEGFIDATKDFLFNRLDDALEPIARLGTGKLVWDEMKENAIRATTNKNGGARHVAHQIAKLMRRDKAVELHIVGHSAGSILHAPLIHMLTMDGPLETVDGQTFNEDRATGKGLTIKTVTLWAPACTVKLFWDCYEPAIREERIEDFALFTLTDAAEQDDNCARIYNKSLLYLVSHAFEKKERIPGIPGEKFAGEPILGMEWWVKRDPKLKGLLTGGNCSWITAPNSEPDGSTRASAAQHHGAFDDDERTLRATLSRILGPGSAAAAAKVEFRFPHTQSKMRERRAEVMR